MMKNTKLYTKKLNAGHFKITAVYDLHGDNEQEKSIETTNMPAFDDAFNCDFDNDCTDFESIEEAKQYFIDLIYPPLTIRDVKKALKITDKEIAKMFNYKNTSAYATSSAKNRIENGLVSFYELIHNVESGL